MLLVPSLFGASSQVALHSAGAECYSSEAWTTPALRPILVLSCPSMKKVLDALGEIKEREIKKANSIELYEYTKNSMREYLGAVS